MENMFLSIHTPTPPLHILPEKVTDQKVGKTDDSVVRLDLQKYFFHPFQYET